MKEVLLRGKAIGSSETGVIHYHQQTRQSFENEVTFNIPLMNK